MTKKFTLLIFLSLGLIGFLVFGIELLMLSNVESQETTDMDSKPEITSTAPPTRQTLTTTPIEAQNQSKNPNVQLPGVKVFSFGENEPGWYSVDDTVMGGVSNSSVEIIEPDILFFSGTMSLENNGGFSSARSDWKTLNLAEYNGVLIHVLGDGKSYRLRIRSGTTGSEISYNPTFETNPYRWEMIYIPFDSMVPTYRGFVMNVDKLDTSNVGSFGLMLSDEQSGDFELKVNWIRAVTQEDLSSLDSN
jgi:hypothetical protein